MEGINKIVIIGAGERVTKIGELFSKAGLKVVLGKESYSEELDDADLILEALIGDIKPRKEVLYKSGEKTPPDAILATTAPWGITEIAAATRRPERVIGLNFTFNPFQEKCLVQMVKGLETSEETIEVCRNLAEKVGTVAVVVEDSPGLILDHVIASVINEAATMYVTKVATIEDIDRITKLCLNWPMGPFEFADVIGIDNVLVTLEVLSRQEGAQFLPCRLLRQMVASGRLGKKTRKGFYTY